MTYSEEFLKTLAREYFAVYKSGTDTREAMEVVLKGHDVPFDEKGGVAIKIMEMMDKIAEKRPAPTDKKRRGVMGGAPPPTTPARSARTRDYFPTYAERSLPPGDR